MFEISPVRSARGAIFTKELKRTAAPGAEQKHVVAVSYFRFCPFF